MNNVREESEAEKKDAFLEVMSSLKSLSNYEAGLKQAYPQIFSCAVTVLFHLIIGITFAFSAVLIPQLESPGSDIEDVNETLTSLVASIVVLIVPIGGMLTGFLMEYFGRLLTLAMAALPFAAGWAMIAYAPNIYWILAGRILHGFACAIGTSPAIVYITEVSRPDIRGSMITLGQSIASLGNIISYTKGAFISWRLCAWMYVIYSVVPAILIKFIPESPVWLVSKGRIEDAAQSLKFLYKNYPQPEHTTESLADMHLKALLKDREKKREDSLRLDSSKMPSKWAGFLKPTGYKPLIILFFLFMIQHFSGVYITLFYAVTFLKETGTQVDAFEAAIFVGVVRFCMSILNVFLLKRFKRRHLIMISSTCMAACMFTSGAFTIWIREGATHLSIVPVICLLLYVCSSMVGMLSIPWTMTAELFPDEIRGMAHSVAFSIANIIMFSAIQNYRNLTHFLGGSHAIQWFFAAVAIIGFFFALFFLPETHGKKLSEIEAYFTPKPRKTSTTSKVHLQNIYKFPQNYPECQSMLEKKQNIEMVGPKRPVSV